MLRESEVAGIAWEAVDDETLWVYGKREKYRAIPIADTSTWSYLSAYRNELRIPLEQRFRGPIFRQLDHEELPITKHTVEHLLISLRIHFQRIADAATRKEDVLTARAEEHLMCKLHTHIFRITGATFMANAGMNLVSLSLLLGHSDPSTTLRYYVAANQLVLPATVRTICAKINAALEKVGPLSLGQTPGDQYRWYRRRGLLPPRNG